LSNDGGGHHLHTRSLNTFRDLDRPSTFIPSRAHMLCPYDPVRTRMTLVRSPCGSRHSIDHTSVDERRIVLLHRGRSHRLRRPVPSTSCGTPRGPRKDGRELMELMESAQTPLYYDHHHPHIRRGLCFIRRGSWGRETPLPLLFKPSVLGWRGECSRGAGVEPSTWSPPRFPRF